MGKESITQVVITSSDERDQEQSEPGKKDCADGSGDGNDVP